MTSSKTYKGIDLYETMPKGWRLDTTWGSPLHTHVCICDGKSPLLGGKKGLLAIKKDQSEIKK